MICERILGNLNDATFPRADSQTIDLLSLTWQDLLRRFLRTTTSGGRDVGLLLPAGHRLQDRDVIYAEPRLLIVVDLLPTDVLVMHPKDARELATTAYLLGDLHCPVQVADGKLIVPAEDALAALLSRLRIESTPARMRFSPIDRAPLAQWQVAIPKPIS